jgi:hypothetical protein
MNGDIVRVSSQRHWGAPGNGHGRQSAFDGRRNGSAVRGRHGQQRRRDLVFSGRGSGDVLLSDARGDFSVPPIPFESARVTDVADITGDGRLDLIGLNANNQAVRLVGRGTKNYNFQVYLPRAQAPARREELTSRAVGDQRINSFAVGGESRRAPVCSSETADHRPARPFRPGRVRQH